MFYSSSTSLVCQLGETYNFQVKKRFEISESNELDQTELINELYPKVIKKKVLKKVRAKGRKGKNALTNSFKFDASI